MFHIGERVKGDSHRRKHKWKASGVNTHVPSASVLSSLSEEMNGLTTESAPRRLLRRATRLSHKGCWQSNPWMPRCGERPSETSFDEGVAFTFGENFKERRRYRSKTRRPEEGVSPVSGNKQATAPSLSREPLSRGPSEQIFEALNEEYAKKAEKLKALGNEALSNGYYAEAREKYSEGMRLIMGSFSGRRRLMSKLHSNRAAAFLCEDDPKSALNDCLEAKRIHPKNIRAYARAATCCTCMGDFTGALKMLEQASEMLSASDPQFKSIEEQVSLVQRLKTGLETVALRCAESDIDAEVLSKTDDLCFHVRHFDRVWRLAALVYVQSGNYEQLQTIKKKFLTNGDDTCWWRWIEMEAAWWDPSQNLTSVLTAAEILLLKIKTASLTELDTTPETPEITVDGLQHLLEQLNNADRSREDGKAAVSRQSYTSAEKLYSEAIAICASVGSPMPFLSVLYCNRGAALHGQGRYLEGMSDVCISISLHPEYAKGYLRLAQMHLETRNSAAAAEIAKEGRTKISQTAEVEALSHIEQKAASQYQREEAIMDAYKIMGLSRSCTAADIKKAFRKFALKLHPDKAAQLVKLKVSWMEGTPFVRKQEDVIRRRLHDRLSHLFKHLNAAHSILMNEDERAILDEELEEAAFPKHRRRNHYYECYQYYSPRC